MPRAFTPAHLPHRLQEVEVGTPLPVVGVPLGLHDTLHHLPVVRQPVIASAFGLNCARYVDIRFTLACR